MKILALGDSETPVALWRIVRPMRELAKHLDWEIDYQKQLVMPLTGDDDKQDFTENELEYAAKYLGSFDVVFVPYYMISGPAYALMLVVTKRHGTKFVIDIDDNIFAINEDNPIWLTVSHERMHDLQTIIIKHPYLVTTTELLARELRIRRPEFPFSYVAVIPNYITDDYTEYNPNNGEDRIVIGYFGGSSHFADLNASGFPKAMRDIMREHKNVHFRTAGVPLDIPMAASRESFIDSVRGEGWAHDVFPQLQMDIVVAPLLSNKFNEGKSNIKWQEATRAGAAFVASRIGPYMELEGQAAILVPNTRKEWFHALEYLVKNPEGRASYVAVARDWLGRTYRLEDHWQAYQTLFEHLDSLR